MSGFRGQRVQMVGTMVQPTVPPGVQPTVPPGVQPTVPPGSTATPGATATGSPTTAALPQFRVQSVVPISGNCPPR
jgi:hypothetical protein